MARTRTTVRYSGLGVAVLGFVLTRLLVAETLQADAASFMVAGLVPLLAGLALALFGVALAVGAFTPAYARTVWIWSIVGTFAMAVVLTATALHSVLVGEGFGPLVESRVLVANVLLGGAIGGTIVGDRSAVNRRQREDLARYAERTMLVNRVLRHEILNATAIVRGYAEDGDATETDAVRAIRESAERVEDTLDVVSRFASTDGSLAAVDLGATVESVLEDLEDGGTPLDLANPVPTGTLVRADERLDLLVGELLENAVEHPGPDADVELSATVDPRTVELTVRDTGPGLPDPAREVLAARSLPEYDDPSYGYGLQMVRLLVEHYGGDLSVDAEDGTAITVTLQRTTRDAVAPLGLGLPRADLVRAGVAATVAGVVMGVLLAVTAGTLPVIGALYGVASPVVGWVTHLFHSLVFGLLFAAGCSVGWLREVASSDRGRVGLGVAWGLVLWLVAAGLVMPVWLMTADQSVPIPNLRPWGLVAHLVWGAVLGWLYAALPRPAELLPDLG